MTNEKALQDILDERGKSYGTFEDNLYRIFKYKSSISVSVTELNGEFHKSSIEFIKNMLALKAARSEVATGESLKDCIYDFVNYYLLFIDAIPNSSIQLDSLVFDGEIIKCCANKGEGVEKLRKILR